MTVELLKNTPEKKNELDDNARKFISAPIDADFLDDKQAASFALAVDWLETDEASEKKVAYKQFPSGDVQILLISKVTQDSGRKTVKQPISPEKYNELATASLLHLEKTRYEFTYRQEHVEFGVKYDVFAEGKLYMIEVDAPNDDERAAFVPEDFPYSLKEVTGNMDYYGYRMCRVLEGR